MIPSESLRASSGKLVLSNHRSSLGGGQSERADLFIEFQKSALSLGKGHTQVEVNLATASGQGIGRKIILEVPLVGPY